MLTKHRIQLIQFLVTVCCVLLTIDAAGQEWIRNPANGNYYRRLEPQTWQSAEEYAVFLGGHLVAINDSQEQNWLVSTFGGDEEFWIGLNDLDQEGTWAWTSGEPVTFVNWAPGQPDDNIPGYWHLNPDNGHYYSDRPVGYWSGAEAYSRAWGGHLVSIGSSAEQAWLIATFGGHRPYWIGFTDRAKEGKWVWTSGETVTFTNWASGEPDDGGWWWPWSEDYAVMNLERPGKWNDLGSHSSDWHGMPGIAEVENADALLRQDLVVMNWGNPGQWADVHTSPPLPAIVELPSLPQELGVYYPGRLQVNIQPQEAIDSGAVWWIGEGQGFISGQTIGLEPGHYSLQFYRVDGWEEPEDISVYISGNGETVVKEYTYESLPSYNIGDIPPQTAWHDKTVRFLVTAATAMEEITMYADPVPNGSIDFQPSTGQFSYAPDPEDKEPFEVTFETSLGESQTITVTPMTHLKPEQTILEYPRPRPDAESDDYIVFNRKKNPWEYFNHQDLEEPNTLDDVTISGYTVVFEKGSKLYEILNWHGPGVLANIRKMTIYAETVIVRTPLRLPQTDVTIYARELRFEDPEGTEPNWACIDTTPLSPEEACSVPPGESQRGKDGRKAGDITLHVERFYNHSPCPGCPRFILRGGKGQKGGLGKDGETLPEMPYHSEYVYERESEWPYDYYQAWYPTIVYKARSDSSYKWYGEEDDNGDPKVPEDGGKALPAGKPGNGGAGGHMEFTLPDLEAFADLTGGKAGEPGQYHYGGRGQEPWLAYVIWLDLGYWGWRSVWVVSEVEEHYSQNGDNAPAPEADVPVGPAGTFITHLDQHFSWLHPLAVERVLDYIKDAYIAGHFDFVQTKCEEYITIIEALQDYFDEDKQDDFDQLMQELIVLRDRVANHLDYFGNPAGWVPMLSFEANKVQFKQEIQDGINVLYLTYWLGAKASAAQATKEALLNARDRIAEELPEQIELFSETEDALGGFVEEMDHLSYNMGVLQGRIEARERELLERWEDNLKHPFWKKGFRVLGTILKVIPVYQPALAAVGTGLDFVSRVDTDEPLESLWEAKGILTDFDAEAFKNQAAAFQILAEEVTPDYVDWKKRAKGLLAMSAQFAPAVINIHEILKANEAPKSEVEEELARLEAEDPIFQDLVAQMREFNAQKMEFAERLATIKQTLLQLAADIQQNLLAGHAINGALEDVLEKLDHRTLAYIKQMERRQKDRLLKYQYYLAKAYEYRMLEPYDGDLNLNRLFNKCVTIADGNDHDLEPRDFDALKFVYTEELRRITADIWDELNANAPERSVNVRFGLTAEELKKLNEEGKVTINLVDRETEIFSEKWENFRIFKLRIEELLVHPEGGLYGNTALLFLTFEHSGVSKLSSSGETYLFRHYTHGGVNPITWDTGYDGISDTWEESGPSRAGLSLLEHLLDLEHLPYNEEHVLLYTRPAAWADIVIYKEVSTDNDVDMVIDSLRLKVQYDYFKKPADQADLTVEVLGDLMPNIFVNTPDRNGRQDGRGDFRRAFYKTQHVTLSAQPIYGQWEFVKWADDDGDLAFEPAIDIVLDDHKILYAVYARE